MAVIPLTLIFVGVTFLGVAVVLGVLVLITGVWDAWEQIPQDVRCAHRKWQGPFGHVNEWFYAWACLMVADLIPEQMSLAFLFSMMAGVVLLVGASQHLVWALRTLRNKATSPASLLRFARYAVGFSAIGIMLGIALFVKGLGFV